MTRIGFQEEAIFITARLSAVRLTLIAADESENTPAVVSTQGEISGAASCVRLGVGGDAINIRVVNA